MNLLLRLYEPTSGRILIDGVDIRRYTRASLRRAIGVVPQDNMLFAVSVRENIAYGRPDATSDEKRWKPPPARRARTSSSSTCPRATTPSWASARAPVRRPAPAPVPGARAGQGSRPSW
jgi:ABC-type branched-subunit amino acid transport system ATPase component